jgi:hypothetical protein
MNPISSLRLPRHFVPRNDGQPGNPGKWGGSLAV